jgi:hypothetical protein
MDSTMKAQKSAIIAGLVGGIGGFVFSAMINYFILPMPESLLGSALDNGMSGLISGFMGGYLAIRKKEKNERNTQEI